MHPIVFGFLRSLLRGLRPDNNELSSDEPLPAVREFDIHADPAPARVQGEAHTADASESEQVAGSEREHPGAPGRVRAVHGIQHLRRCAVVNSAVRRAVQLSGPNSKAELRRPAIQAGREIQRSRQVHPRDGAGGPGSVENAVAMPGVARPSKSRFCCAAA